MARVFGLSAWDEREILPYFYVLHFGSECYRDMFTIRGSFFGTSVSGQMQLAVCLGAKNHFHRGSKHQCFVPRIRLLVRLAQDQNLLIANFVYG